MSVGTLFPFDLVLTLIFKVRPQKIFCIYRTPTPMLSYNNKMNELEKFYQSTFLTNNIIDRCIHCHKHNSVQVIVRMEINGQSQQGPFCRNCYLDFTGLIKYFNL